MKNMTNRKRFLGLLALLLAFVLMGGMSAPSRVIDSSQIEPGQIEPGQPVRIVIKAIEMDLPLVAVGLDKNRVPIVPRHDVGWYRHSAMPMQGENIVLWGHVLRFRNARDIPAPFAQVKELTRGDRILLYTADGNVHPYIVGKQIRVTPDQVEYILPQDEERLTLVSCIGERIVSQGGVDMSHRLITLAWPASLSR